MSKDDLEKVERKAEENFARHNEKIQKLVSRASALIDRAIAHSEKSGIPFQIELGGVVQTYRPESFDELFAKELEKYFEHNWEATTRRRDMVMRLANIDLPYDAGWDSENWEISSC